jgi:nucleotide-binding universal stress UspA family protein
MLRTVLLAYDGSEEAEEALSLAIELVRCLQADMHVVAVVDPDRGAPGVEVEADRRYAWQRLRDAENLTARAGLTVRLDVVEGEPAAQIVEQARRVTADIIVLGHARHGRLDRLTGGSVVGLVLDQAPCAVLMPPVDRS